MFKIISASASGATGKNAVTNAWNSIKDAPSEELIGVLVFASSTFEQAEIVDTLQSFIGADVPFVGASTAGEIGQQGPSQSPSVSLMLFYSDTIRCHTAVVEDVSGKEQQKAAELAEHLLSQSSDIKYCTIHSDGLTVNPNQILTSLADKLGDALITGGSAGDDGNYKQTHQYCNGKVYHNAVAVIAFSGPLKVAVGVRHGWNPISGLRTVTAAEGQVVHTINDKPAIELYEEFLGAEVAESLKEVNLAKIALSYPIGVIDPESGEMLLRAPFYVDQAGSITFGGEVPQGSSIQLMIGSKEEAVAAAGVAAQDAMNQLKTSPAGALIYSCHVRDTLFASRNESQLEIAAIQHMIGADTPIAGFYTYAEQAPVDQKTSNGTTCASQTHNETIVAILFSEEI